MDVQEENNSLTVTIPTYRNDINIEVDLIEEVARIYGYNNLPKAPPRHISSPLADVPIFPLERQVRGLLIQHGMQECITCDLISPDLISITAEKSGPAPIAVLHPRALDQSVLRTSLLPGLLQVVRHNFSHQTKDLQGFEIGRIHFQEGDQFKEQTCAGIILTGKKRPHHFDPKPEDIDFFDLKGVIENLLQALHIAPVRFLPSHLHTLHPGRQAKIEVRGEIIGTLGEVHPHVAMSFDIQQKVYFAELNLHDLLALRQTKIVYQPLPTYPGSERDWTLSLKIDTPINVVTQAIESVRPRFLENYFLLDLFQSPQIGNDRKNATFRFSYRDPQKTIELEAVEKTHEKMMQSVAEKLRDHIV